MSDTRYRDADWLEEQYHEYGLSQREIADKCDVDPMTVCRWMEKHDIERRDRSEHLEPNDVRYRDEEWLHKQYHEKELTTPEIGDKCGVAQQTVRRWMDKYDIERRSQAEINRRIGLGIQSIHGYQMWYEGSLNKRVAVHRLLAVAEYGFDAVCDMDVHHKNGIRWDNRPDNIELLTHSEHCTYHMRERHDNGDTRYRDEEWLKEQYHEDGLSTFEIADKCDVDSSTVLDWMQKHGIERREPNHNPRSDKPTGQLTLDDTRELEGAQTVNQ